MQDLIAVVRQGVERSATLNDQLAKKYSLASGDPPISGLNMAHWHSVLSLESLANYDNLWRRPPKGFVGNMEALQRENGQRVVELTKSALILSLSAFEFCAKESIALRPQKIGPIPGRTYLRKIIRASVAAGFIPVAEEEAWGAVIELRNALVHNNGISEFTKTYALPNTQGITFVSGQQIEGKLTLFPQLQLWATEAFARWCDGFLS